MREKIIINWSGGKDSALALYELQRNYPKYEIVALLTVLSSDYDRISMHGVERRLLEKQAAALGLKLEKIYLPCDSDHQYYEKLLQDILLHYRQQGVTKAAFGDIFLEDLRQYRQEKLAQIAMRAIFPLWKRDTASLAHTFIERGFKTIITCVDTRFMNKSFAGRLYDHEFLRELPAAVDPAGENGEFHTFTYDGPIFTQPITCRTGATVLRDNRFCYCELIPD